MFLTFALLNQNLIIMTEREKDILRMIPSLRMEAKSTLKMISNLQNSGKGDYNSEINKYLDLIYYFDKLEEELKKKKD